MTGPEIRRRQWTINSGDDRAIGLSVGRSTGDREPCGSTNTRGREFETQPERTPHADLILVLGSNGMLLQDRVGSQHHAAEAYGFDGALGIIVLRAIGEGRCGGDTPCCIGATSTDAAIASNVSEVLSHSMES